MRYLLLTGALLLSVIPAKGQEPARFTILHTNDMHSRLMGSAPGLQYSPHTVNDDPTTGGFARLAAVIDKEEEGREEQTLVLDAGDFLMGTMFHALEEETGFQLPLMKEMGYDVVSIGNHEFDFGPGALAWILKSSAARGKIPEMVLSNMQFDKKEAGDDLLEDVYAKGLLQRYTILERQGVKIGVFGLMGKDADEVAPYAVPVTFGKTIKTARKTVKELEKQGCDLIICLSHSGLEKEEDGSWSGEDAKLARRVKAIDVIISGHTHSRLSEPLVIGNTLVVQAASYGKYLGKLTIQQQGDIFRLEEYELIPVDDRIAGDRAVQEKIEEQKALLDERILKKVGISYDSPVVESSFELVCDEYGNLQASNLGPLLADAIHWYVQHNEPSGTDISMIAAGVIRDGIKPGIQSVADLFRVVSLGSGMDEMPGYPLARVYVTGKELKSIMEILMIAWKSSPSNYCYFSGVNIHFNQEKGFLRKVEKLEITGTDGSLREVSLDRKDRRLYAIVANAYMLEFVGMLKKMSFGLINVEPKNADGEPFTDMSEALLDFDPEREGIQEGKEWMALLEYVQSMEDLSGNGIPEIRDWYREARSAIVRFP